jgi:hypothetical protein
MRGGGRGMTTKKFTNIKDRIGGGVGAGGDARLKIIAKKRSQVTDARDRLASMAKTTDARQKLEKIRNIKEGKVTKVSANLILRSSNRPISLF